jgi:hypothetical protein
VVLLTDFGLADHYVGVLHAVLEREAPGVRRIDLGHMVPPGDVWAGCFLLRCAWPSLPDRSPRAHRRLYLAMVRTQEDLVRLGDGEGAAFEDDGASRLLN